MLSCYCHGMWMDGWYGVVGWWTCKEPDQRDKRGSALTEPRDDTL